MNNKEEIKPWKLSEITQKDVQDHSCEVVIIPVGSTEPHGMHLPYRIDFFNCEKIAGMACEKAWLSGARVLLLPVIP